MALATSHPASAMTVTRGRRLSKGQATASITILPRTAHTFDDTAPPKPRPDPHAMQRQDSGYESLASAHSRKPSIDSHAAATPSRSSTNASRRPTRVTALAHHHHASPPTLFQFPEPDIAVPEETGSAVSPPCNVPPTTTHYWTSDHTRRLEYAAIDAARRGVRGWVRRNLVPRCMAAKDGGHLDFDDDSGSVRRYRLDIDEAETGREGRRGWLSWLKA